MRVVILSALLLLLNLGWIEAQITKSGNQSPNIIIILADDLGFDDVSFRGGREFLTPNIDALAYHGRILDRLYAPPICTPSRAAILSGKYPIHTGTQHFVISNQEPWAMNINTTLMPEIFRNAGYSTNLVGKWHLGFSRPEYTPTRRGFDYHFGYWGGYIDYYSRFAKMPPDYNNGYDFRRNMEVECADRDTYMTDLLTNEAERLIRDQATKEKPLFLMLSHLAPHTANPNEYLQAPEDEISKFKHISDPHHRKYAAMVSRLDQSVGRVISALESTNQLANSIVIFSSDNGGPSLGLFANTASNYPLKGQKSTPWEGGVRVAAAIWSPLLQALGSPFKQPMYVGDFLPTLAHAAGIQLPESLQLDGIDLWPQLSGPKESTRLVHREILHMLDDMWQVSSFMSGNWKYVNGTTSAGQFDYRLRYREINELDPRKPNYFNEVLNSLASKAMSSYDLKPLSHNQVKRLNRGATVLCGDQQRSCNALLEECLFNLNDDPCETNNLVYSEAHAQVLRELRERVQQLRAGALEPTNRESVSYANPSLHKCTWLSFEVEPVESVYRECRTNEGPCGS